MEQSECTGKQNPPLLRRNYGWLVVLTRRASPRLSRLWCNASHHHHRPWSRKVGGGWRWNGGGAFVIRAPFTREAIGAMARVLRNRVIVRILEFKWRKLWNFYGSSKCVTIIPYCNLNCEKLWWLKNGKWWEIMK